VARNRAQWLGLGLMAGTLLLILSCGGGGDSGSGGGGGEGSSVEGFEPAAFSQMATLDQESAETTVGLIGFARSVGSLSQDIQLDILSHEKKASNAVRRGLIRALIDQIEAQLPQGNYQAAGAGSETVSCANGGEVLASFVWDGPDLNYVDNLCEDVVNLRGTMTWSNCQEPNLSWNGTIAFEYTGDICRPTAFTFTLTNLVLAEPDYSFQTRNLQMSVTSLDYWADYEPKSWMLQMNGQAVGRSDGDTFAIAFKDYNEAFDGEHSPSTLDLSGWITGACLDGWVELSTPESISIGEYEDCPVAGVVVMRFGNGLESVAFNDDGSMCVGYDQCFENCQDLNATCPLP
jgi:hypothetical protein